MSVSQVLLILVARWRVALAVFMTVVLAVTVASLLMPRKYTATSAVVLDVKSPDPIAGVVLPGMTVSGYMGTQVEVLQSERVLLKAIHTLGLANDAMLRADWQDRTGGRGSFESWIAELMTRKLSVVPGKDSNVVLVSYTDRDPETAARVANAIVAGYIETTLELRTEPAKQFSQLFDATTKALREDLEHAQTRLSDFQQRNGIAASDEKLDVESARLSELSSQMVIQQASLNDSASRQEQARTRGDQMQEVASNPLVMNLGVSLATQEARLKELSERLGDHNPQVMELRANIAELQAKLNAERARITGGLGVANSINQSKIADLRQSLEQQRVRVLQIKALRDEALVLQRDVENAQRAYDAGFARKNQSALESQATQTNVSVIKQATVPPLPSWPRIPLNIAVSILVGAALALMTVVIREKRDWRVRMDEDITEGLRCTLLGVMPDGGNKGAPFGSRLGARLGGRRLASPLVGT